jgi:hypothetical protein
MLGISKKVLYAILWIIAMVAVLILCKLLGFEDFGL